MPKIHVEKTTTIDASAAQVYAALSNLNSWKVWSPWLIVEPEAKVDVSDDTKFYSWAGKRVGSGEMKITAEETDNWVNYDLTFLKPYKSFAKVRFEIAGHGDHTHVVWKMDSALPFFMFWMTKMMIAWIGMDFQRGLALLKDYVESGEIHSKLEYLGEQHFQGYDYIGIKRECAMDQIDKAMEADFETLWQVIGDDKERIAAAPFSIYHKWELVKGITHYTAGLPVKKIPENLPQGVVSGKRADCKVFTIRHIGPYHHLGNAWTAGQMMMRGKEFKAMKGQHPFECYATVPGEVPDNEHITDINFVVK